jgi:hypothetical protein
MHIALIKSNLVIALMSEFALHLITTSCFTLNNNKCRKESRERKFVAMQLKGIKRESKH